MTSPRVHLAIDNCFTFKRWTDPQEWACIVRHLGVTCVEVSADNECDPLYTDPGYLEDWICRVQTAREETGVKIVNLYSGHRTYTVLGLASPDRRNRERILNQMRVPCAARHHLPGGYENETGDRKRRSYCVPSSGIYDDHSRGVDDHIHL